MTLSGDVQTELEAVRRAVEAETKAARDPAYTGEIIWFSLPGQKAVIPARSQAIADALKVRAQAAAALGGGLKAAEQEREDAPAG